ncbi:NADP-dependent oxidoreductase domain-containing protein [Clohesyomyces aquaticus]|uniref:NADP-dependent oxidoreductase domain-containing protein n=1 Tax=Clohesyomyces aquaticus TaxID=1231657 RepID=A0A1Y1ZMU6_9PLEO|nr:NADP-dependent oxidoreductase domain-containing protein [Clohesyomyces aquaticus]
MAPNTAIEIVFGAMTIGKEGIEQVSVSDLKVANAIVDIFQKHGHSEIDTSRFYGDGTSEEYLAAMDWQGRKLIMDTKFFPNTRSLFGRPETHLTESFMRTALSASLKALGSDSVDLWYLHAPDRSVPIEGTLKSVNALYKEGKFKRWGVSNYMSWEVAAICEICLKEGYPLPSTYQGVYNAIHRPVEQELFPCLRKYGIEFYAFNPLGGGYLTDRYHRDMKDEDIEKGSRFDKNRVQGQMYRARYWHGQFFDALDLLREAAKKHGLRESECALRWMMHHSQLKREFGDKVIIGASSEKHMEQNMKDFELGPLPQDVVEAFDKGWEICRGNAWKYFW